MHQLGEGVVGGPGAAVSGAPRGPRRGEGGAEDRRGEGLDLGEPGGEAGAEALRLGERASSAATIRRCSSSGGMHTCSACSVGM
jgi:hypothetical protein